jgi:hypothetical protein
MKITKNQVMGLFTVILSLMFLTVLLDQGFEPAITGYATQEQEPENQTQDDIATSKPENTLDVPLNTNNTNTTEEQAQPPLPWGRDRIIRGRPGGKGGGAGGLIGGGGGVEPGGTGPPGKGALPGQQLGETNTTQTNTTNQSMITTDNTTVVNTTTPAPQTPDYKVPYLHPRFNGRSTQLDKVNITKIKNLVLERVEYGRISFNQDINLLGVDNIDKYVSISHNRIEVDTSYLSQLNKSATLTLVNLTFVNPIILKDGEPCADCTISSYNGTLIFNVQHFSAYSAAEGTALKIWDQSDSSQMLAGQQVEIYANYTNRTTGEPVAGAACQVVFSDTGTKSMAYNSTRKLQLYNRSFSPQGVYYFNITCSAAGHTTLNASDYADIDNSAGPSAPTNITVKSSERRNHTPAAKATPSRAGNTSELKVNATIITTSWQGYYGNIQGEIVLDDADGSSMYDWTISTPEGEIYASRASDVNFATINCSTQSNVNTEEIALNMQATDADSVNSTFNATTHSAFSVGSVNITANSCRTCNLYVSDSPQSTNFFEVLLSDGASNMVYTSLIDADQTGFDDGTYDFEMIVGENGKNGDTTPTEYYFFIEIS